jgi:hypothetical protein
LWHDKVFSAFRETKAPFIKNVGNNTATYPLRTLSEKVAAQSEVIKFLRLLDDAERFFWINHLVEALEVTPRNLDVGLMLTWDEVKMMHQHRISFGSHTVTHPILSKLNSREARSEIQNSKTAIEEKLSSPVKTFAYPGGKSEDFNEATKEALREAGYVCALTAIFGANRIDQDRLELRRGTPWEQHLPSFATKLHWYKFCS